MATGHLRKRLNKKGEVSYQITVESDRDAVTGERNRTYKTIKGTKKQAETEMRKMISEIENGGIVSPSALTVKEWMKTWLNSYKTNIEETTKIGYQEKIDEYINPYIGHIPIKSLQSLVVQNLINDLKNKGLAPKTIRNFYNILNPAMKKAVELRMIPYNPCEGATLPKLVKFKPKVYDKDQIAEVLEKAKGTDMYLIVVLEFSLGIRRGELCALRWSDIDFENKVLTISKNRVNGKNGNVIQKSPKSEAGKRTISFGSNVEDVLKEAKKQYDEAKQTLGRAFQDSDFVIHKGDGQPYHPDSLTQKWSRFLERNGFEVIRLHDARHSHATALVQSGVNVKVVQERLGHSDVTLTLNTYTHVLPSMDREAANVIDSFI